MNQDDDSNVVEEAASIRSVGCVCVCGDIACDSLGGVEMRAFVEPFVSLLATSRTYTLARSLWLWHHVLIWHRTPATGDFDCSTTCGPPTASDLDIARSCCTTTTNDHLIESSSECSVDLVVVRATAARHISCTTTKHNNSSTSTNFNFDSHDKLVP